MNTNNIVKVDITLPKLEPYTTKYNIILLENSKVTVQELIRLFESFYNQSHKSFTFIFDFSKNVENCVDYLPVMEYVDDLDNNKPDWSYYVAQPFYLGNRDIPTTLNERLNICSDLVYQFLGSCGTCILESVWYDINHE